MNLLKSIKTKNQTGEISENLFLNSDVLNIHELKQIKGGTPGGDDDDDDDELINPE